MDLAHFLPVSYKVSAIAESRTRISNPINRFGGAICLLNALWRNMQSKGMIKTIDKENFEALPKTLNLLFLAFWHFRVHTVTLLCAVVRNGIQRKEKSDKRHVMKSDACVCSFTENCHVWRITRFVGAVSRFKWRMLKHYLPSKSNWTTNSFTTLWRFEAPRRFLFIYLLIFPLFFFSHFLPIPKFVCVCVCVTFIDAAVATTIMLSSSSQLLLLLLKIKMRMFVFGLSKCKLYVLWISTRHMFHLRNFSAGSLIKMDSICCWLKREMLRFSSLQFFGCCCFFTLFILVLDAVFQSRRPTPPTSSSYSYPSSIYLFGQQKPRKVHIFE